jgi:hypothetical protein
VTPGLQLVPETEITANASPGLTRLHIRRQGIVRQIPRSGDIEFRAQTIFFKDLGGLERRFKKSVIPGQRKGMHLTLLFG